MKGSEIINKEVIRDLTVNEIKIQYADHVRLTYQNKKTQNTKINDAFYLHKHCPQIDFIELLLSDNFEDEAKRHLYNALERDSRSVNFAGNLSAYLSHLKSLKAFLVTEELSKHHFSITAKPQKQTLHENRIPMPCNEQVEIYLKKWATLDKYVAQENSIKKLFSDTYPYNTDIDDVLIKVSSLNDFYSTHIYQTYLVAKHIVQMNIDERLSNGDLTLVNDLSLVNLGDKDKCLYSFVSKYCSHHNEHVYPIYDSYVAKTLKYFKKVDKFARFSNEDLRDYVKFNDILNSFRCFYGLKQYSLKQIDKYLWLLGKEYFPNKNYKQ